jgi:hypothetical protein
MRSGSDAAEIEEEEEEDDDDEEVSDALRQPLQATNCRIQCCSSNCRDLEA